MCQGEVFETRGNSSEKRHRTQVSLPDSVARVILSSRSERFEGDTTIANPGFAMSLLVRLSAMRLAPTRSQIDHSLFWCVGLSDPGRSHEGEIPHHPECFRLRVEDKP
jgi:hypothetical protein